MPTEEEDIKTVWKILDSEKKGTTCACVSLVACGADARRVCRPDLDGRPVAGDGGAERQHGEADRGPARQAPAPGRGRGPAQAQVPPLQEVVGLVVVVVVVVVQQSGDGGGKCKSIRTH